MYFCSEELVTEWVNSVSVCVCVYVFVCFCLPLFFLLCFTPKHNHSEQTLPDTSRIRTLKGHLIFYAWCQDYTPKDSVKVTGLPQTAVVYTHLSVYSYTNINSKIYGQNHASQPWKLVIGDTDACLSTDMYMLTSVCYFFFLI